MVTMDKELHVTFAWWVRPVFRTWLFVSWPLPTAWRRRIACKLVLKGTRLEWR